MVRILSVVERLYHRDPRENPFFIESSYSQTLKLEEEPYQRTYQVGAEYTPLDKGWVEEHSMLHISNTSDKFPVSVMYGEEEFGIPPKASMRFYPKDLDKIKHSAPEVVKITVTVFPA